MLFSLQKTSLTNFRGVSRTITLDYTKLPAGLYFVRGVNQTMERLGSNGASKTTIFSDSITWALAGRVTAKKGTRVAPSSVENRGATGSTDVRFQFGLGGAEHLVSRSRNPNNLDLDGTKVVQEDIDKLLPISDSALRRSIIVDQLGELFLSLSPEEKSGLFSDILELDSYLEASDRAGDTVKELDKRLTAKAQELVAAEATLKAAEAQIDELLKSETRADENKAFAVAEAKKRLRVAAEEYRQAAEALDVARETNSSLEGAEKEREKNSKETKLKALQRSMAMGEAKASRLVDEANALKKRLEAYADGEKTCPECGQVVTDEHRQEQRAKLEKEITYIAKQAEELDSDLTGLEVDIEEINKDIAKLNKGLVEFQKGLTIVAVAAERSLGTQRTLNGVKAELERLEETVNPYTAAIDKLEKELSFHDEKIKEINLSIDELTEQLTVYSFWQKGFREIRLQIIDSALLELELAANKNAEALGLQYWTIEFSTERETAKGTIQHKLTVFLYEPGNPDPIPFESYSGGEGQRWQLATTFAFSDMLLARAGLTTDFEILDEPTHHMSPEGIEDLLVCLKDRAQDMGRRIFLIDHNSISMGDFDGVFTVTKTKSGVTVDDGGLGVVVKAKRERVVV